MPSAALPMARLYQDRDGFSHTIIFSCVSWFKYSQTSCPFVSIRGSSIPSFRFFVCFVCFVVQVFPDFVSIRVHSWFILPLRHFVYFVPFVLFVVQMFFLVSIRVHSWFIFSPPLRGSYLSAPSWFIFSPSLRVHSWPRRTTAPSKNRPAILERLSKRFTFLPATRRHSSRMGLPGRPR